MKYCFEAILKIKRQAGLLPVIQRSANLCIYNVIFRDPDAIMGLAVDFPGIPLGQVDRKFLFDSSAAIVTSGLRFTLRNIQMIVPTKAFFTKGVGFHKNELQSYELALRDARIEKQNMVSVSSIFPPNCEIVDIEEGLKLLRPGQITFCVMARLSSDEYGRMIGASVGIAFPSDRNQYGYISEFHAYGQEEIEIGDFAEDLASTMLATTLGVEFDPDKDYDERREIYLVSGKVVKALSFPCVANGMKGGHVTVISCVVFLE